MKRLPYAVPACLVLLLLTVCTLTAAPSDGIREVLPEKTAYHPVLGLHIAFPPDSGSAGTGDWPDSPFLPPITWPVRADFDFCQAAANNPIDAAFAAYGNDLTTFQLAAYIDCWDEAIDSSMAALQALLPEEDCAALRTAQDGWRAWRSDGAAWARRGSAGEPAGAPIGSFDLFLSVAEQAERTRNRAVELWFYRYLLTGRLDFIAGCFFG